MREPFSWRAFACTITGHHIRRRKVSSTSLNCWCGRWWDWA